MATNFDPTKIQLFNQYELLSKEAFEAAKEYYQKIYSTEDLDTDLLDFLLGANTFDDYLRRVVGLGWVNFGNENLLPLFARTNLFESSQYSPGNGVFNEITISLNKALENNSFENLKKILFIFQIIKDQHSNPENIYEDKNFVVDDIDQFGFSITTVSNNLNTLDISNGDDFFINGQLASDKDETSLKYAYAFEQYEIAGTTELIQKEVRLAEPLSQKFIDDASNEGPETKIKQLQNIIYDAGQTQAIEKTLQDPGGEGNIGVEKIYNVLRVTIPAFNNQRQKQNILDYIELDKTPAVNPPSTYNNFFNTTDNLDKQQLINLISELSFINFVASDTSEPVNLINKLVNYNGSINNVLNQVDLNFAKKILKNPLDAKLSQNQVLFIKNFIKEITSGKSDNASLVYETDFLTTFIDDNISVLQKYNSLLAGEYSIREPTINGSNLNNNTANTNIGYNISELYQLLFKSPFINLVKTPGSIFSLFRKSRLSGLKIVKSEKPYDPKSTSSEYSDSIIQTYFVDVRQDDQQKTISLFDSQIIYNKEYYYTVFGIYEVDGKYYNYSPIKLKTKDQVIPGSTPDVVKELNSDISVGVFTTVSEEVVPVNGCCRYSSLQKTGQLYQVQSKLKVLATDEYDEPEFFHATKIWTDIIGEGSLSLKGFSQKLNPNISDNVLISLPGFTQQVSGLTRENIFDQLPKGKENSIVPLINAQDFYLIPWLTVYLYRAWTLLKKGAIEDKSEFKKDPILGFNFDGMTNSEAKLLQNELKNSGLNVDVFKEPLPTKGGASLFQKTIKEVFNKRRDELYCFLCRRAQAGNNITPALMLDALLKEYGILDKDKPDENFLGTIVDCRRYGYVNANGTGGVLYSSDVEIATRKDTISSVNVLEKTKDDAAVIGIPLQVAAGSGDPQNFEPGNTSNPNRCYTNKLVPKTEPVFDSYTFYLREMDTKFISEVALDDVKSSIVGYAPMPPDVTFVPLADVDNKILIRFQEMVQSQNYLQPIDDFLNIFNNEKVIQNLEEQAKEQGVAGPFVLARSQGDLQSVLVVRTDEKPESLYDLITSEGAKTTEIAWKDGELYDNLVPNKDYWYVFGTRDITGLYSGASNVFKVKIVNDSGYTYVDLEPYEFEIVEQKTTTKTFKKLLKIKPSFDETIPVEAAYVGSPKLFSRIQAPDGEIGPSSQPPKFKIRIRSRKTKRAFDINLKFTQDVQQVKSAKLKKIIEENAELIDSKVEE